MPLRDLIRATRAVRAFSEQAIDDEQASAILDAGRLAQSGANLQPWHFVAIRQREMLQAVASQGDYAGHFAGATLGVVIAMPLDDAGGWNWFDCGQAAAYMQLAATELGIGSCIAALNNLEETRRLLGIPPEFKPAIVISFGYPADTQVRAPRRGGRRTLDEVVHWERW
jgi:nitroreductase